MNAGQRLSELSGMSGVSAGIMLASLADGATAGARLVNHSRLSSATAAVHLLVDGTEVVSNWITRFRRRGRR